MSIDVAVRKKVSEFSLSDDYFSFIWIVSRGVLIIACIIIYTSFSSLKNDIDQSLDDVSRHVSRMVGEVIRSNETALLHLGKQLERENVQDYNHISRILGEISYLDYKQTLYRTNVVWVTNANKVVASSLNGVHRTPHSPVGNSSAFLTKVFQRPWTVFINPTLQKSIFSPNPPMIHMSLAISKGSEGTMGRLASGINLDTLMKHVFSETPFSQNKFVLLDHSFRVMGGSPSFKNLQGKVLSFDKKTGAITEGPLKDLTYTTFKRIPKTPFYVLVGTYENVIGQNFLKTVLPKVLEVFLVGVFCLLLLYIYRKKFLGPITNLSLIADKISKGQSDFEIPTQRSVEMQKLAEGFRKIEVYARQEKEIKEALERHHQELSNSYEEIESKNTELKHVKKELESALVVAQDLEETKEKFREDLLKRSDYHLNTIIKLANASINSLKRHNALDSFNQKQMKLYTIIREEAIKLHTATLDVLDFTHVDLNGLLKDCLKLHAKLAHDNRTSVQTKYAKAMPDVLGDQTSLRQAFASLLEQSINFTPDGTVHIKTTYLPKKRMICISIIDNGFGLPHEEMARILGHLKEGDKVCSFDAIKKIIKAHHGQISEEKKTGNGRTFKIMLPLSDQDTTSQFSDEMTGNVYPLKANI